MSTTTSNGYKKPNTGDRNFWSDLEDNIDRINSHSHDGTDSEKLQSKAISNNTSVVSSASWGSVDANDNYSQTITVPTDVDIDNKIIQCRDSSTGAVVHADVIKASSTTITITVNDNTLDLEVIYG